MHRRSVGRLAAPASLVLSVLLASSAHAQTSTIDEGAFRLTIGGHDVGTETFSIRQNGSGPNAVTIAQGRVLLQNDGSQDIASSLELSGPELRPAAYQVTVQGGTPQKIAGRVTGGRFSARIMSPSGEMMREYLASDGAVLVDEGVVHQYYFVVQRAGSGGRVPVIIPQLNRQVVAVVTASGSETLDIGGQKVSARHYTVAPTGLPAREVWVDGEGRVLRMAVPSRQYVAIRNALPRG
ncbi:MAG TPA: hypothetical protein VFQ38_14620 [Longimicrobiales bacterium]|nr:hypothetical protein [Longimicrobiales bacterium]